jgi:hypothetical protein
MNKKYTHPEFNLGMSVFERQIWTWFGKNTSAAILSSFEAYSEKKLKTISKTPYPVIASHTGLAAKQSHKRLLVKTV